MRLRMLLAALAVLLLGASCGDDDVDAVGASSTTSSTADRSATTIPDRQPTVVGVVARSAGGGGPVLVDASDPYFEGMALLGDDPVIVGDDGSSGSVDDLTDGATVAVWTGDGCAESYPVQCLVIAIQIGP